MSREPLGFIYTVPHGICQVDFKRIKRERRQDEEQHKRYEEGLPVDKAVPPADCQC